MIAPMGKYIVSENPLMDGVMGMNRLRVEIGRGSPSLWQLASFSW